MGNVVPFDYFSRRWPTDRPGLRKPDGPWRTIDLGGRRPEGHCAPAYGPRQKVILAVGQAWVECHTQELYVIKDLVYARSTFYSYDVVLVAYKRTRVQRLLAEATFRGQFRIWDKFEEDRRERIGELFDLAENDSGSPWRGRNDAGSCALNFFGLDEDGYRID